MDIAAVEPKRGIWRHSAKDGLLVLFALLEAGIKIATILFFDRIPVFGFVPIALLLTYLNCMNYEVTGHYFIHNPFFRSARLNAAFAILNSIAFGFPQTLYRAEHINHHQFGCDLRDPATGETRDQSSIYRFGPGGKRPEPLWRYALLGPLREDVRGMWRATPRRLRRQLAFEALAVLALLAAAAAASPLALLFMLAMLWTGSAASHYQSWLEHAHARPGSRLTDSVSSYGRLYNLLWFNNGYHQEHHFRPSTHWSALPALRAAMLPEAERRVVPHAHLWNRRGG
ncbi:MAG TPA: fatty acid desaturase [Allosphingosinicella sp.]|nr:fatty acid desaturase [Allosphingosinicella sp.]